MVLFPSQCSKITGHEFQRERQMGSVWPTWGQTQAAWDPGPPARHSALTMGGPAVLRGWAHGKTSHLLRMVTSLGTLSDSSCPQKYGTARTWDINSVCAKTQGKQKVKRLRRIFLNCVIWKTVYTGTIEEDHLGMGQCPYRHWNRLTMTLKSSAFSNMPPKNVLRELSKTRTYTLSDGASDCGKTAFWVRHVKPQILPQREVAGLPLRSLHMYEALYCLILFWQ